MNEKQVKTTAAAMKSKSRLLKRKENRELKKINERFEKLSLEFYDFMFGIDWDEPGTIEIDYGNEIKEVPISEFNVFDFFNQAWIDFCAAWNRKHKTPANPEHFHEKLIDNYKFNPDDRPVNTINPQFTYLCWVI